MPPKAQGDATCVWSVLIFSTLILLVLQTFGGVGVACGDERRISFREALKIALTNNNEIKALSHTVAAEREGIEVARSQLFPRVSFEERFMRTTNPTYAFMAKLNEGRFANQDFDIHSLNNPDAVNDYQTTLLIEQRVFEKKVHVGLEMSKTEHAAQSEKFKRKREEIVFSIASTFLMIHTAKEYLAVTEKAVADAGEHARIAQLRFKENLGLYSDTLRAATSLTEASQKQVSAKKNLELAKRSLGIALGLVESIDTTGDIPEFQMKDIDYYTSASLKRKDIKSMELKSENAKNNIRLAESDYFPSVGVGGSYQLNDSSSPFGSEGNSWQVMAFLHWNIFEGTKTKHETAKARFKALEAEEQLKGFRNFILYRVFEAYAGIEEAKKNVEFSREALKSAEEGRRLVKVRYENALSPIVDLLDAQLMNDRARMNLVMKENEYRAALLNLSFESGTVLSDLNIESE
jgi:outer membrane protein